MSDSENILKRRRFLRGKFASTHTPIRPPWAYDEAVFIERCSRCNACIDHCETGILFKGDGGFPEVDFARGECTFCQACVSHCQPGALSLSIASPWNLVAWINESCLAQNGVICMTCREQCPEQAIEIQPRLGSAALPVIDSERCNGCGACFAPCPTQSIQISEAKVL
ncbi:MULTISPECIES: ferredoxin-type protein NapF [Methylomonas]|uniref:Ferredoxin-type protein NapF n=2 Tax=Methylomonas TaxID=416 RepID=A0A126T1V6_9GAMM|nr:MULTISPECIES: ferredoxin-type protein NapF [Methylomonas]AMK76065.1 hypothetical protein JT25_006085 [Methylomonas denitrificans]OAH99806.1 hypothetical protein A1342_16690 [Methylomonas methanica]TCV83914.1 ferredoxin-type protein NapF [Methylomonas methanica]